jgi:hypothetical protein
MYGNFNLERSRFEFIKKKMSGFETNQIFEFKQILRFIKSNGIEQQEIVDYIEDTTISVTLSQEIVRDLMSLSPFTKPCPDCGSQTILIPVNDSPGYMVGGKYRSMFYCVKTIECGYEFYSEESVNSIKSKRIESAGLKESQDRLDNMRRHHSIPSDPGVRGKGMQVKVESKCGGCADS